MRKNKPEPIKQVNPKFQEKVFLCVVNICHFSPCFCFLKIGGQGWYSEVIHGAKISWI
jgi:hypothetical protein